MKAIMMSIRPEWCELIFEGKKTIEVRKTAPKVKTPIKVYVYETKAIYQPTLIDSRFKCEGAGAIIGEFICDRIDKAEFDNFRQHRELIKKACIKTFEEFLHYATTHCYFWHLSDLVIYDQPKKLSEFKGLCKYTNRDCFSCPYYDYSISDCKARTIKRPPQSFMYVEAL